jgi:hypothetical protein
VSKKKPTTIGAKTLGDVEPGDFATLPDNSRVTVSWHSQGTSFVRPDFTLSSDARALADRVTADHPALAAELRAFARALATTGPDPHPSSTPIRNPKVRDRQPTATGAGYDPVGGSA